MNTVALVGMSAAGKGMSDWERKQIADTIVSESEFVPHSHTDDEGLAFELSTNLATAKG